MKLLSFAIAAVVVATALPASADMYRDHHHHGMRACHMEFHHHHRVRVCR